MLCLLTLQLYSVSGGFLQTAQTWANARVYSASCAYVLGSVFVCCLFYKQFTWLGVMKGRFMIALCNGFFYFRNMWWILFQKRIARGEGIKRDHCSVDVAPGGYVWPWCLDGFIKPGGGVMLIVLFNIL